MRPSFARLKERMLLADRTHKIAPPGTSKMRELANALERSSIDVINCAAGELDGDASDPMKSGARLAISQHAAAAALQP